MQCPNCDFEMHQVKTSAHYGTPILLDQCAQCGGVWFDEMELFKVKPSEAEVVEKNTEKIELVDSGKLRELASTRKDTLLCPRDKTALQIFSDPYFPKEIQVENCPHCGGFWFNRGELKKFKAVQAEKIGVSEKKGDGFEKQVEKILAADSQKDTYNSMGNLGKYLSKPIQHRPDIFRSYHYNNGGDSSPVAEIAMFVIRVLLQTLLRR